MYLTICMTLFLAKTLKSRRVQIVDVRQATWLSDLLVMVRAFLNRAVRINGKRVLLVLSSLWVSLRVRNSLSWTWLQCKMARWTSLLCERPLRLQARSHSQSYIRSILWAFFDFKLLYLTCLKPSALAKKINTLNNCRKQTFQTAR